MKSCIPNYNSQRMLRDYVVNFYAPASRQNKKLSADEYKGAKALAAWKTRINRAWSGVSLRRTDAAKTWLMSGDNLKIEVAATLGELTADDVVLECIIGTNTEHDTFVEREHIRLQPAGTTRDAETVFSIDLSPPLSGLQFYKLRLYPSHPLLSHPFETGHIVWL